MKESKKSYLEKAKFRLFRVLEEVLNNIEIGKILYVFLTLAEFLTLLAFPFHDQASFNWKPEFIYDNVLRYFNIFRLVFIAKEISVMLVFIFLFLMGVWCGLTVLVVIFSLYQEHKNKLSNWVIKYLKVSILILCELLFMPAVELFLTMFECEDKEGDSILTITYQSSTEINCFSNLHILFMIFAFSFLLLLFSLLSIHLLFLFEVRINAPRIYNSRYSNDISKFNAFTKFALVLSFLIFKKTQTTLLVVIMFVIAFMRLFHILSKNLFHRPFVQKFQLMLEGVYFWISACLFLGELLTTDDKEYFSLGALAAIVGIPIFTVMLLLIIKRELLLPTNLLCKKQNIGDMWLISMNSVIQIYYSEDTLSKRMKMLGYMSNKIFSPVDNMDIYAQTAKDIDLLMLAVDQRDTVSYEFMLIPCYQKFLHCLYDNGFKQSTGTYLVMSLAYAIFMGDLLENSVAAILHLENQIQNHNLSLSNEFIILRLKKEKMRMNNFSTAKFEMALKIDRRFFYLKKNIKKSAEKFYDLWALAKNDNPMVGMLERGCSKVVKYTQIVEWNWEELIETRAASDKALRLYANYHLKVLNDPKTAAGILKRAGTNKMDEMPNTRAVFTDVEASSPCIHISSDSSHRGSILDCNFTTCEVFGYPKSALINQSVNVLMPEIFARKHDKVLKNADLDETIDMRMKERKIIFGRQATGTIFCAYLEIKKQISFSGQAHKYVGIVRQMKHRIMEDEGYMLLDNNLRIRHVSQELIPLLHLNNHILKYVRVKFNEICLSSSKLPFASNSHRTCSGFRSVNPGIATLTPNIMFSESIEVEIHVPNILSDHNVIVNTLENGYGIIDERDSDYTAIYRILEKSNAFEHNQFLVKPDYLLEDLSDEDSSIFISNSKFLPMNSQSSVRGMTTTGMQLPSLMKSGLSEFSETSTIYSIEISDEKRLFNVGIIQFKMDDKLIGYGVKMIPMLDLNDDLTTKKHMKTKKVSEKARLFQFSYSDEYHRFYPEVREEVKAGANDAKKEQTDEANKLLLARSHESGFQSIFTFEQLKEFWEEQDPDHVCKSFFRSMILKKITSLNKSLNEMDDKYSIRDHIESQTFIQRLMDREMLDVIGNNPISIFQYSEEEDYIEIKSSGIHFAKMGLNDNELGFGRKIQKNDEDLVNKNTLRESIEKQKKTPIIIKLFLFMINTFFVALIGVSLFLVFQNDSFLKDQEEMINLTSLSLVQICKFLCIRDGFRDFIILNQLNVDLLRLSSFGEEITDLYRISGDLEDLYSDMKTSSFLEKISTFEELKDPTSNEYLISTEGNKEMVKNNQRELFYQLIAVAYNLMEYSITEFQYFEERIYYFMKTTIWKNVAGNFMNELYKELRFYLEEYDEFEIAYQWLIVSLIIATCVLNIAWLSFSVFVNANMKKLKIVALNFLIQIPYKSLTEMSKNCETFLNSVKVSADDDEEGNTLNADSNDTKSVYSRNDNISRSNSSEKSRQNASSGQKSNIFDGKKKKRNRMLKESSSWMFFMATKLLLIFVVVEGFFLTLFFMKDYYSNKLDKINDLMIETARMEIAFIQTLDLSKELFARDDVEEIQFYLSEFSVQIDLADKLSIYLEDMERYSAISKEMVDIYEKYLNEDLCPYAVNLQNCPLQAYGSPTYGLMTVTKMFLQESKDIKYLFESSMEIEEVKRNIITQGHISHLNVLFYHVMRPVFTLLKGETKSQTDDLVEFTYNISWALTALFLFSSIFLYLFILLPFMTSLHQGLCKIHSILLYFPADAFQSNVRLLDYTNKLNENK